MPTNLYGPNDNFDLQNSHVLPAMMRKFHDAKVSGTREAMDLGLGKSAHPLVQDRVVEDEVLHPPGEKHGDRFQQGEAVV